MIPQRGHPLVLAIYLQSRGFAFVLFDSGLTPVDWGIHESHGPTKNARCLTRMNSLLELHAPDVVVLQDMSDRGTHRASRIQQLNEHIAELAILRDMLVHKY
jgi:hypothetical protein